MMSFPAVTNSEQEEEEEQNDSESDRNTDDELLRERTVINKCVNDNYSTGDEEKSEEQDREYFSGEVVDDRAFSRWIVVLILELRLGRGRRGRGWW